MQQSMRRRIRIIMKSEPKKWITVNGKHIPIFEGMTEDDIKRDIETYTKADEHEKKLKDKKSAGKQAVADARDAIKKYGPKRGMWEDFNAADKVWTSISSSYSSGKISREDYEKAYHIFGDRFFEMRKTRNRKR